MEYLTPIVTVQEVADDQRYGLEEENLIEAAILASQALLYNANAFHKFNPLTKLTIRLMVGYWLENRDNMGFDFKSTEHLPFSITSMINSLRFWGDGNPNNYPVIDESEVSPNG